MPGNPRDMIVSAERRFPVRIRIGVPPGGFGQRYAEMTAWLDEKRRRWLGDDTVRDARGAQRCGVDLFPRRYLRERLRCEVVHRLQNRDGAGRNLGYGWMSRRRGPQRACTGRHDRENFDPHWENGHLSHNATAPSRAHRLVVDSNSIRQR
jgi:hypothetical protein